MGASQQRDWNVGGSTRKCAAACSTEVRSGCVDAAPTSVAPGQIPPCALRGRERHVVDDGRTKGVTAQQQGERHPATGPESEASDRLVAIDGAGRQVAAV